ERAGAVAPALDRDVRRVAVRPLREVAPDVRQRVGVPERDDRSPAVAHAVDELVDAPELPRAAQDVDVRELLEQRRALALRHAAEHRDDHFGSPRLGLAQLEEAGADARLRVVAHGARVERDDVGIGAVGREDVAPLGEPPAHELAVEEVHLAAERLEEDLWRRLRRERAAARAWIVARNHGAGTIAGGGISRSRARPVPGAPRSAPWSSRTPLPTPSGLTPAARASRCPRRSASGCRSA